MVLKISEGITAVKDYAANTRVGVLAGKTYTYLKETDYKQKASDLYNLVKKIVSAILLGVAVAFFVAKSPYLFAFSAVVGLAYHDEVKTRMDNLWNALEKSTVSEKLVGALIAFFGAPVTMQVASAALAAHLASDIPGRAVANVKA